MGFADISIGHDEAVCILSFVFASLMYVAPQNASITPSAPKYHAMSLKTAYKGGKI